MNKMCHDICMETGKDKRGYRKRDKGFYGHMGSPKLSGNPEHISTGIRSGLSKMERSMSKIGMPKMGMK